MGGWLLFAINITCTSVQMLIGHMRPYKTRPFFIYLGLILSAGICLMVFLPRVTDSFTTLIILAIISGSGVAVVHPEALRAVHILKSVPSAIGTSVFLAGGFAGFSAGGWIAAALVSGFGLEGLYPFLLCPFVGVLMILFMRIRLAVENETDDNGPVNRTQKQMRFWPVLAMIVPAVTSSIIIISMLPTCLNELGFGLGFGGFCTMIFGLGSMAGSFFWSAAAHKKGEPVCSVVSLLFGLPFLLLYLIFIENRIAVWLLFGGGFCSAAAYPLMVTMARHSVGLNLGQRMGFVLGGAWALGSVILMALWFVAKHYSVYDILKFAPAGYVLSAVVGILIMLKTAGSAESYRAAE
jgi:FSR family fosmidomycin resistance protein-like MFS transporter